MATKEESCKIGYLVTSWTTSTPHLDCLTGTYICTQNVLNNIQSVQAALLYQTGKGVPVKPELVAHFLRKLEWFKFYALYKTTLRYHYTIQTDASGSWGCKAFFQEWWLQWKWPAQWMPMNIMAKEMVPVVLNCSVWGPLLGKHSVLFECNNSSVVAALLNGTAKDNAVMHLLHVL